jgi:ribosomal protein S18 acetylase RimI-like enzyme
MTEIEYVAWQAMSIPTYASEKVASGQWSEEESLDLSRKEFAELLPRGLASDDNYLFTIVDSGSVAVGVLWFAVKIRFNTRVAYVYDVSVLPEHQRKGHAYHAFLTLEDEIRKLGLSGIALHVFGHNTVAQALYAKLGYRPTNISLFKSVTPPVPDPAGPADAPHERPC